VSAAQGRCVHKDAFYKDVLRSGVVSTVQDSGGYPARSATAGVECSPSGRHGQSREHGHQRWRLPGMELVEIALAARRERWLPRSGTRRAPSWDSTGLAIAPSPTTSSPPPCFVAWPSAPRASGNALNCRAACVLPISNAAWTVRLLARRLPISVTPFAQ
jgi:hypothetical protein